MSEEILTEVATNDEVQTLKTDLSNIKGRAEAMVVKTDDDYSKASTVLKWIADTEKKCESRRKFFVDPLNEHVRRVNLFFKNFTEPLNEFRRKIEAKMLEYRAETERKRQEEEKRLMKQQEKVNKKLEAKGQEPLPAVAIPQAPKTTFTGDGGTVTAKKVWAWQVVDEKKIPREWFSLDEKKVNAAVRGGLREIPGIKIFQKESLAVR